MRAAYQAPRYHCRYLLRTTCLKFSAATAAKRWSEDGIDSGIEAPDTLLAQQRPAFAVCWVRISLRSLTGHDVMMGTMS